MRITFLISLILSATALSSCGRDIWGNNQRECHVIKNADSFWADTVSTDSRDYGLAGHFYRRLKTKCENQADTLNKYKFSSFDHYTCSCSDTKVE